MASLGENGARRSAVAVSGGGDSLALMLLLAEWAARNGQAKPVVLTVDHGLRNGSAKDARAVATRAKRAGLSAHVLLWRGAKPASNIEAAARDARYRLMGEWCSEHDVGRIYVAHTLEDQAETFLLRLARGSGIDGLSAMRPVAPYPLPGFETLSVIRPLLAFRRQDLREFLTAREESWVEDAMNMEPRFARARLRAAWPELERLGLRAERIASAANHLSRARWALERDAEQILVAACRFEEELALLDASALKAAPHEIGLRVLATALMRVSGEGYRPRFERLERLYARIIGENMGGGCTLHGCRIGRAPKARAPFGQHTLLIAREPERRAARYRTEGERNGSKPGRN